ncbi:MAG: hypothetical protein AAF206_06995 [Bacteroidota bacterium]
MKLLPILLLLFLFSCKSTSQLPAQPDASQRAAIQQTIDQLYAVITIKDGKAPQFREKMEAIFFDQAPFTSLQRQRRISSRDDFISNFEKLIESGRIKNLDEREMQASIQIFGKVAHCFSSYEMYVEDMSKPADRGINSIQMIETENGWKVISIAWDVEKDGQSLPKDFLPKKP